MLRMFVMREESRKKDLLNISPGNLNHVLT